MGCTSLLVNSLCFECKDKEWNDQNKEYFCKRYDIKLTRVDGNSGGAVRTRLCICGKGQRPRKQEPKL